MPYKNTIINPKNISSQKFAQQSQFYKGFTSVNENNLTNKIYDIELVKQDIINMFQTKLGERVMNPTFGTIIWNLIYDPFTDEVKQAISEDVTRILNYDPRAIATQITITETEYGMIIDATLFYVNRNLTEQMNIAFNKETGIVNLQQ